jgi:hypothetical protein
MPRCLCRGSESGRAETGREEKEKILKYGIDEDESGRCAQNPMKIS